MNTRRMNQSALAHYVGTSSSTVSAWLNRDVEPSISLCKRIAEVLKVEPMFVISMVAGIDEPDALAEDGAGYGAHSDLERQALDLVRQMPPDLAARWLRMGAVLVD